MWQGDMLTRNLSLYEFFDMRYVRLRQAIMRFDFPYAHSIPVSADDSL